jgi:ribonuclease BN (tRNA processing enzyme)
MPQPSRDDELDRIFNQTVVEDLGIPEWWVKQSKAALHSHIEEAVREARKAENLYWIGYHMDKKYEELHNKRIAALTQEGKTE